MVQRAGVNFACDCSRFSPEPKRALNPQSKALSTTTLPQNIQKQKENFEKQLEYTSVLIFHSLLRAQGFLQSLICMSPISFDSHTSFHVFSTPTWVGDSAQGAQENSQCQDGTLNLKPSSNVYESIDLLELVLKYPQIL